MRKIAYPVAKCDEILPDTGKTVPLGEEGECTLFFHDGRYYAVGSLCPHQNAPLDGARAEKGSVTCRRHGYCFDLKTGDCLTIGGYGLPVYEVRIEGDTILVNAWSYD